MNQRHGTKRARRRIGGVLLIAALLSAAAQADEIRIKGIWRPRVTIVKIEDGRITRVNDAGIQIQTILKRVEGLKVDAYPRIARAEAAIDREDLKSARGVLTELRGKVRQPWLRDWVTYRRMTVSASLGEARDAVDALLSLSRDGADPFYFARPPVGAFERTDPALAKQLGQRLEKALRVARGAAAAAIRATLAAAEEAVSHAGLSDRPPEKTSAGAEPAIALSSVLDAEDPVTRLLQKGEFQAALGMTDKMLAAPTDTMSRRLYQRGMARIGLGDQSRDFDLYKSAGLDFMRVLIYYPRSPFRGAALLETAYVHQKIGRPELASKLFDRAKLYIQADREPGLAARLDKLIKQQPEAPPGG